MRTAAAMLALALLSEVAPAQAHFAWLAANDPVNEWLGRQHSSDGSFCCNKADAHLYYGAYTINADGSVTIPLAGGELVTIEPGRVLGYNPLDPNPTATSVWWYRYPQQTFCFALGPLT